MWSSWFGSSLGYAFVVVNPVFRFDFVDAFVVVVSATVYTAWLDERWCRATRRCLSFGYALDASSAVRDGQWIWLGTSRMAKLAGQSLRIPFAFTDLLIYFLGLLDAFWCTNDLEYPGVP